jgi:hypothetical protein
MVDDFDKKNAPPKRTWKVLRFLKSLI